MTAISNSEDETTPEWKREILEFLQVEEQGNAEEQRNAEEQKEVIYYNEECAYCGKRKGADHLKRNLLRREWMCDECYKKRILKKEQAVYLADQSLKMLSLMYRISPWKQFKVIFKLRGFRKHHCPWDKRDVLYWKWIFKYDRMLVRKKLPEETAEAAIVSVLLDHYLIIREMEIKIRDLLANRKEQEAVGSENSGNSGNQKMKGAARDRCFDGKKKGRNGLVVWCTIHYLYIVQGRKCAEQYEERLSDAEKGQYTACEKRLGSPLTIEYIHMEQILKKLYEKEDMEGEKEKADGIEEVFPEDIERRPEEDIERRPEEDIKRRPEGDRVKTAEKKKRGFRKKKQKRI